MYRCSDAQGFACLQVHYLPTKDPAGSNATHWMNSCSPSARIAATSLYAARRHNKLGVAIHLNADCDIQWNSVTPCTRAHTLQIHY